MLTCCISSSNDRSLLTFFFSPAGSSFSLFQVWLHLAWMFLIHHHAKKKYCFLSSLKQSILILNNWNLACWSVFNKDYMCFAKEVYLTRDELSVPEKISGLYGVSFSSYQALVLPVIWMTCESEFSMGKKKKKKEEVWPFSILVTPN